MIRVTEREARGADRHRERVGRAAVARQWHPDRDRSYGTSDCNTTSHFDLLARNECAPIDNVKETIEALTISNDRYKELRFGYFGYACAVDSRLAKAVRFHEDATFVHALILLWFFAVAP